MVYIYYTVIPNEIDTLSLYSFLSHFLYFNHLTDYELTHPESYDSKDHFLFLTSCLIQEELTL